jgi:hypothetical protein
MVLLLIRACISEFFVYDEYMMKRGLFMLIAPAVALLLTGFFVSMSARSSAGQPGLRSGIPSVLTPTPTPPIPPVFTATMYVVPNQSLGNIDDTFYVRVAIEVSQGCVYPIYDLTLRQAGDDAPIFDPDTETVGPGVANPYTFTLHAISPGTVTFEALAYGERNCGDYWNWRYVGGASTPVTILPHLNRVYFPFAWREESR